MLTHLSFTYGQKSDYEKLFRFLNLFY
jgi:hypothetical protein